jgi:hypothetical protein
VERPILQLFYFSLLRNLEVQLHGSGRAGFDTDAAGNAFFIVKLYLAGIGIQFEDADRTDGDASAAMGASILVTEDILTE